ncbi:MAG: SemiSWEET family transporter [Dehalococcoidia bacterium]|nr:SemiSWEET family transporter [Dehalococcoidia bacterium]
MVGILASAAVVLSWAPQVRRILVTKRAGDISFGLPIILMAGSALWVAYGLHLSDPIIVTVNTIVFFVNILVLVLKRRYRA